MVPRLLPRVAASASRRSLAGAAWNSRSWPRRRRALRLRLASAAMCAGSSMRASSSKLRGWLAMTSAPSRMRTSSRVATTASVRRTWVCGTL